MFDYDTWYRTYSRVMARLAEDAAADLTAEEAKAVPQRWFTDYGGFSVWDGEPFPNLDAWADDAPHGDEIARTVLIAEAERMLREVTDPAIADTWRVHDEEGSRDAGPAAVRALIRYLRAAQPTYHEIARRIYHDESWDTEISEYEAKTIAAGWASDTYCPHLARWVDGHDVDHAVLCAEARSLWGDLGLHREDWPHEGEAEPSIAAVAALTRYLDTDRPN